MTHSESAQKLIVTLTHGAGDDKSTVAFTVANAALSKGLDVAFFLSSDAVELARDGSCDFTQVRPFKPLDELITGFIAGGGVVWVCSPCFQHRGLKDEQTVDGVIVTGAGPMLEWVAGGASTLSF